MTTFYTSDWHFGHVSIMEYCPQRYEYLGLNEDATTADMDEALVELWNGQVSDDDVVFVLGDICMGKMTETLKIIERLNGRIILVPGNHDRMHPCRNTAARDAEWTEAYTEAGLTVLGIGPHYWTIDGVDVVVSHFPAGTHDHSEEGPRYMEYRPVTNGPVVHGHVHDMFQTDGMNFNVGIDAWNGRMVTPEEIGEYFRDMVAA